MSCTKCIHYRAPSSLKLHKADINHPKDSNFVLSYSSASVCVCVLVQSCTLMVIGSIASLLKRNIKKSLLLNIFLEVIFFWHKHNHPLNCDYFLETEAHTEVLSQNACSLKWETLRTTAAVMPLKRRLLLYIKIMTFYLLTLNRSSKIPSYVKKKNVKS